MTQEEIRAIIREELAKLTTAERWVFQQHLQLFDGKNIQVGKGTGSSFGTETSQKIAFHGATPVIQATHISDPSGGATQDAQARSAINDILVVLENKGFTATS